MTTTTRTRRRPTRPEPSTNPDDPIAAVRPRTSKTKLEQLERMGITTGRDLLWHLPRYYEDRCEITPVCQAEEGMRQTFHGYVSTVSNRQGQKVAMQRARLYGNPEREGPNIDLIWFGQAHLARRISPGDELLVSGEVQWDRGPLLKQPDVDVVRDRDGSHRPIHNGIVTPTYSLTAGMTQDFMRKCIPEVLDTCRAQLRRCRPNDSGDEMFNLLLGVHRPETLDEAFHCLEQLARDELLTMQITLLQNRSRRDQETQQTGLAINPAVADACIAALPFNLTDAQQRCIAEIRRDLTTPGPSMNRLLQGDVGSGKTAVAMAAALDVASSGGQTALLAPTELLAEQHFASISSMISQGRPAMQGAWATHVSLERLDHSFCVALLTGSTSKRDRRQIAAMLKSGSIDLLIGTHAIIQSDLETRNLKLAIADEAHRFGVNQRNALRQGTHYLMLTATAIPRTMQLAVYRDLDVSTINQMPASRIPIETVVLAESQRHIALDKIREEVNAGRQAFIVFPLIEENEAVTAKAATEEYERLRTGDLSDVRVGLIHGRMPQRDRELQLRAFKEREIDVLVTTAVIEVGIDIPNATVMLIESAERFGIAQLHQFRGRIGRGSHASTCFIMITPEHSPSPETRRRLIAVRDNRDGMRLAEIDLSIRGHGDIAGLRQAGQDTLLKAAAGYSMEMLEQERLQAEQIHQRDPQLESTEHRELATAVKAMQRKMSVQDTDH